MRAIVTVVGKDRVGIIAQVCTLLSQQDVNVLDISQTVLQGYFTMIMLVDASASQTPFAQLVKLLEDTGLPCILLEERETYMVNPSPRTELFPQQLDIPLPPVLPLRHILGREVYQAVAFFTREEELAAGPRFFPGLEAMRWHPDFVDVIAPGGGKDQGMDAILAHFGIPLEATMAFGDGENDLPMLRHAHIGVAMGNAGSYVKSQADYVTGTVDEDGILAALEHFGLL